MLRNRSLSSHQAHTEAVQIIYSECCRQMYPQQEQTVDKVKRKAAATTRQLTRLSNASGMQTRVSVKTAATGTNPRTEVNQLPATFRLTPSEEDSKKTLPRSQRLHLRLYIRTSVTTLAIEIISLNQTSAATSLKILMETQLIIISLNEYS